MVPFILAVLLLVAKAQPSPDDEALLLAFKDSFDNGEEALAAWNSSTPLCQWEGVTCNNEGRVEILTLQGYGLKGSIPSPVGWDLPETLTELWFRTNSLTGTVPEGWLDNLPPELTVLDLSDNMLTGTLPVWNSHPRTLSQLFLAENRFSGSIPREWRLPASVTALSLANNLLTGGLPVGLELPPQLMSLELGSNPLKGTIPANWSLPDSLSVLSLPSCQLSGTLSPNWRLPDSLGILTLSNNFLNGGMNLRLPPNLSVLLFYKNRLSGTLNPAWVLPKSLMTLTLSFNRLSGPLPSNWTLPLGIFSFNLNNNEFTSTIPPWPLPPTLTTFDLSSNRLTGELPPDWQLNTGMKTIVVFNNSLTGPLPAYNMTGQLLIKPGNPGLCGEVPATPQYAVFAGPNNFTKVPNNLPACPPESSVEVSPSLEPERGLESSSSGLSSGAIAGIVVGGVAGIFLVLMLAWWLRRKKMGLVQAGPNLSNKSLEPAASRDNLTNTPVETSTNTSGRNSSGLLATDIFLSSIVNSLGQHQPTDTSNGRPTTGSDPITSAGHDGLSVSGASSSASRSRIGQLKGGMEAWAIDFEKLSFSRKIGKGSYSHVYLGTWKHTLVAIKVLALQQDQEEPAPHALITPPRSVVQALKQEATILAAMRHPNILTFMAMSLEPPALVLEYCQKGSLGAALHDARAAPATLPWALRLKLAMGTALAMVYLHSFDPPIVHRDLRSPNILIGANWTPKVCDFDLSKIIHPEDPSKLSSVPAVTQPRWLAPEVLAGGGHTFASDCYSFGIVLWELLTLEVPFSEYSNPWQGEACLSHAADGHGHLPVANAVCSGARPAVPSSDAVPGGAFSGLEEYVFLMSRCWAQEPSDRPTFEEVVGVLRRLMAKAMQGVGASGAVSSPSRVGERQPGPDSRSREPVHATSATPTPHGSPGQVLQSVRLEW